MQDFKKLFLLVGLLMASLMLRACANQTTKHSSECVGKNENQDLMERLQQSEIRFNGISKDIEKLNEICQIPPDKRKDTSLCHGMESIIKYELTEKKKELESLKEQIRNLTRETNKTRTEIKDELVAKNFKPQDCSDMRFFGNTTSGDYFIYPGGKQSRVFCDMERDRGGWTYVGKLNRPHKSLTKYLSSLSEGFWIDESNFYGGGQVMEYFLQFDNPSLSGVTELEGGRTDNWDNGNATEFAAFLDQSKRNFTRMDVKIRRQNFESLSVLDQWNF